MIVDDHIMRTAETLALALALSVVSIGCSAHRNPFQDQVPEREIEAVQALALNTVFESHVPPKSVFPEVETPRAICLGVGQRGVRSNSQWLNQNPREVFWDPSPSLQAGLTAPSGTLHVLSECLRNGNDREMTGKSGVPAVTFFVSDPRWTTPNSAEITVSVRGMGKYTMLYSLSVRRRQGLWSVRRFSCRWARTQCEHFE
jgi:hypothetical protein